MRLSLRLGDRGSRQEPACATSAWSNHILSPYHPFSTTFRNLIALVTARSAHHPSNSADIVALLYDSTILQDLEFSLRRELVTN